MHLTLQSWGSGLPCPPSMDPRRRVDFPVRSAFYPLLEWMVTSKLLACETGNQNSILQVLNFHWYFSSVQSLSPVQLFVTPWTEARQASLSFTISWSLLKLMSTELMMPFSTISSSAIPFSSCPKSFLASESFTVSQFFTSDGQSTGASAISPSNEHPGLISFTTDWLDLLAVQGTLKSLLQHHSSKASILWCSALWSNFHIHT